MLIFASCNSQYLAKEVARNTGYQTIGSNDYVGPAHDLYGSGSFNTSLVVATGPTYKDPTKGFFLNSKNRSESLGKVINIPNLIQKGNNGFKIKISPY